MYKYNIEAGKTPEVVVAHQDACRKNRAEGYTRPPMPVAVQEYYKIASVRKQLVSIANCKDRRNNKYDMEAYTEEIAFHISQTHPSKSANAIVFWKYKPKYYEQEQCLQLGFALDQLSTYKLFRLYKLGQDVNLYISNADFVSSYSRKSQYARSISALMLDIDYYTMPHLASLTPQEVYYRICTNVFAPLGIMPSYGIASGNGLYLVFLIETLELQYKPDKQRLYHMLMERLVDLTMEYGADRTCCDLSRVLRLPSTINQKSGQSSFIIDFDDLRHSNLVRYTAEALTETLGVSTAKPEPPTPRPTPTAMPLATHARNCTPRAGTPRAGTPTTLGKARAADLVKWLQCRLFDIKGQRNTFFMFLASAVLAYMDEDTALSYIQAINHKLVSPQPSGELATTFRSVANNHKCRVEGATGYFSFSNEYIIQHLEIADSEMQQLATIISKDEKHRRDYKHRKLLRRNERGNTTRQQAKADKMAQMQALLAEGVTQANIAKRLGVSRQLVSRYCMAVN